MHLGNGAITPECVALTLGGAAIGLAAAGVSLKRLESPRSKLLLAGGLGALVFAAQAINVPVWPGISGHLVGGVLLAWALGPGLGAWTMALILAMQALLLGDGGLAALGANILNMALLPAGLVAIANRTAAAPDWVAGVERSEPPAGRRCTCAAAGFMAVLSVPLAALLIVGETALFRPGSELVGWGDFAVRMIGTHLWIGLAEGGLTLALAGALARLRRPGIASAKPTWRPAAISLAVAAALGLLVTPWSSELPDGYEAAAEQSGFIEVLE